MKTKYLIWITLLCFSLTGYGAKITAHKGEVKDGYNFWLSEPDTVSEKKPVVIFLHGASLCGNDLQKVKRYGTIDAVERGRKIDAYVIAPQNPGGSWNPEKVMNVLEYVESKHNIDTDRVYVVGMSLGGYGTMSFATAYPDKVAAAIAMCGGNTYKDSAPLNEVPLWIIHGTGDRDVSVAKSDQVVESMKAADPETPRLVYDRIPGMNHSKPARVFYMPETYEWLFEHSLADRDRPVAETFELDESQWNSAYQNLDYSNRNKSSAKSNKSKSKSKNSKKSTKKSVKKNSKKAITKKTTAAKKKTSKKKK